VSEREFGNCKEWKMEVKWSEVKVKEDLLNWLAKLKRLEF